VREAPHRVGIQGESRYERQHLGTENEKREQEGLGEKLKETGKTLVGSGKQERNKDVYGHKDVPVERGEIYKDAPHTVTTDAEKFGKENIRPGQLGLGTQTKGSFITGTTVVEQAQTTTGNKAGLLERDPKLGMKPVSGGWAGLKDMGKRGDEVKEKSGFTWEKADTCDIAKHHHMCFLPLEKRGERVDPTTCLCPLDGHEVKLNADNELFAEFMNGQRIFLCSETCMNNFLDNTCTFLKAPKAHREQEAEPTLILDGYILGCPVCEGGKRMAITPTTPRLFFNHGQVLYFDRYECLESFCYGAKKYVHKCPLKKRKSPRLQSSKRGLNEQEGPKERGSVDLPGERDSQSEKPLVVAQRLVLKAF
jgi:YHS domain-containing protein